MKWLVVPALLLSGCAAGPSQDLMVFAASSLTVPFTELAAQFERQNPGTHVTVSFAGSADLVAQMEQGAEASVLATADEATMARIQQSLALRPMPFATNTMTLVMPTGNPGDVTSLLDLQKPELNVVVCAPQVPCGAATQRVAKAADISIAADSEESAVTDVLGKVTSGEADVGVVYVSDVVAAGDGVESLPIADAVNTTNTYLIAAVSDSGQAFTDFVVSGEGRQILADTGFGPP